MRHWALGIRVFTLLSLGFLLVSCGVPKEKLPDKLVLIPTSYHAISAWDADAHAEALATFLKSCDAFMNAQDASANGQGILLAPMATWKFTCRKATLVPAGDNTLARQFFEEFFVPFRAFNNDEPSGLFTGYYEPLLNGSRTQHRPFMYPVYGLPWSGASDFSRAQIDLGALNGRAPVLAYVDDPVRLFILHVQGSGRIQLEDHSILRVGYAGSNDMKYVSIGKVLAERGVMQKEEITLPRLRQWLYDHPDGMWQILWENPSYIYFRLLAGEPLGTQQVPLTPARSLAVDERYIPLGMPVFLDTLLPATTFAPLTLHRKLLIAQDTGGAIKGPVRGDIFFGTGAAAEELAGNMKQGGQVTLLIPRALAVELAHEPVP
jgi:membrane-bound lytic murein transglycosylase A